jgi:pimeloyl-ACP methyl ester carboxylesterase
MTTPAGLDGTVPDPRTGLLADVPVRQRRLRLAGIPTAVLEAGDGRPLLLLHGPGESAVKFKWNIPDLSTSFRVVAPDLPAHGASGTATDRGPLDVARLTAWLDELIDRTCAEPPVVVGHVLGGAIAARFAVEHSSRIGHLVLVDSLGLTRFRPSPRFALGLLGFQLRPTEGSYTRFMRQCAHDLDDVQRRMGDDWALFVAYNLQLVRDDQAKEGGRLFRDVGLPRIPADDLARITAPTSLIWGRHDKANKLTKAEAVSERFGWPLYVVDGVADDPPRDRPEAFHAALRAAVDR